MVKIAIAGASGKLALEVIEKLVESGKHEIIGLVRKEPSSLPAYTGLTWVHTTYQDKAELVTILTGVHTVLSFIFDPAADPEAKIQKRLIDASVEAGVRRFAPSEWAIGPKLSNIIEYMPWYQDKLTVRQHLEDVNKNGKVIEYTLFQPGVFTNYLAFPHQTAKHYKLDYPIMIDVGKARAYLPEGSRDTEIVATTIQDVAEVAARAVDYEGEWPEIGGIVGDKLTVGEMIRLAEKARGKVFEIDELKLEDLKAGVVKTDFYARIPIPGMPEEQVDHFSKLVAIGSTMAIAEGAISASGEWNKLLPDWKPTSVEEFLQKAWGN